MTDKVTYRAGTLQAQQIDLRLRARYPYLATRLFEISERSFQIWFSASQLDAGLIKKEFDEEICYATSHVAVSNDLPHKFAFEIPILSDRQLGELMTIPLSQFDLRVMISAIIQNAPGFISATPRDGVLRMAFAQALTVNQGEAIRGLMANIAPEWEVAFEVDGGTPPMLTDDTLRVLPPKLRGWNKPYVEEDEAYWHDNIAPIFRGSVMPDDVVDREALGLSCYINPSLGHTLDLRQALLCYDTILLQPPLLGDDQAYFEQQGLTRDQLAFLASRDRLKLVLAQPEERSDMSLISAVLDANPAAVIGRRRAAALVAADLVRTTEDYLFASPELLEASKSLADAVASRADVSASQILDMLLWPITARRRCFQLLQDRGLMGIGSFGVGKSVGHELSVIAKQDLNLEAIMFGIDVHVAHAFRATLVPSGAQSHWTSPLSYMGARLNFYRGFNKRIIPAWIGNEQRRAAGERILPNIPLFDFNPAAPLDDLLTLTSRKSSTKKGNALISRLAGLSESEREAEMIRLVKDVYQLSAKAKQHAMVIDQVSNAADVGAAIGGIALWPFVAAVKLLNFAREQSRKLPISDKFLDSLEDGLPDRLKPDRDLDFLSKVSRVATLKWRGN